ncbi:hypothetical protein Tco_1459213 [Tanacetum coccineum]
MIYHVLTTRTTVNDEVAPRRNAIFTFKVPDQNLLTTRRTMDDEDAPGLKAVLTFQVLTNTIPFTKSNGSNSNHIAKQLKSSSLKPSRKNSISRLHSYPDNITPITRQIQAPCDNNVEVKGFDFLAPTTRRNSMRFYWEEVQALKYSSSTSPWNVFWTFWFTDKDILVIAESFRRRNSWPETNV